MIHALRFWRNLMIASWGYKNLLNKNKSMADVKMNHAASPLIWEGLKGQEVTSNRYKSNFQPEMVFTSWDCTILREVAKTQEHHFTLYRPQNVTWSMLNFLTGQLKKDQKTSGRMCFGQTRPIWTGTVVRRNRLFTPADIYGGGGTTIRICFVAVGPEDAAVSELTLNSSPGLRTAGELFQIFSTKKEIKIF